MDKNILAIHYEHQSVGKRIKSSKKRYSWKVSINTKIYEIELFISRFSGKKLLKINDEIKFKGQKLVKDPIPITETDSLAIIQSGKLYDIFINSIPFDKLYTNTIFPDLPDIVLISEINWEAIAMPYRMNSRIINSKREILPIKSYKFNTKRVENQIQNKNMLNPSINKQGSWRTRSDPGLKHFTDIAH